MNRSRGTRRARVALFAVLSILLVLPFLQYVLAAILIAFVLTPLQRRLEKYVSATIAAFALVLLALVAIIGPFVVVVAVIAGDALRLLEEVDPETLRLGTVEDEIADLTGIDVDLIETAQDAAQELGMIVLGRTAEVVGTLTHVLIGVGLTLFLLYYLLKDGDSLLEWVLEVTPLPDGVQDDLVTELDEVMWAVLAGHVLIAIIEGVIAGLGLFATGIPNATFWTGIMVVLSLVPLIGAFLVWGPAVGYLLLTGEPVLAGALFVYSAIVVGVADDYLRPIVVDRYADLSPAVIILGVLGGVYAFGVMGLFFGPVLLGALVATVNVFDEHYDDL